MTTKKQKPKATAASTIPTEAALRAAFARWQKGGVSRWAIQKQLGVPQGSALVIAAWEKMVTALERRVLRRPGGFTPPVPLSAYGKRAPKPAPKKPTKPKAKRSATRRPAARKPAPTLAAKPAAPAPKSEEVAHARAA